jgi:glutamyl-tRNA reductase
VKILVVGMNHTTAPLEVRERFALDDPAPALAKLVACEEIDEAVIVSTCNRVELIVSTHQREAAVHRLVHFLRDEWPAEGAREPLPDGRRLEELLYEHRDAEAVRHVFRVTASMDSMVVGEPQILGQVKDAYRVAIEVGTCGPVLSRLFQHAFSAAKRVRNETRIAERPVSVARVAVDLARQIFERFDDKAALLVGAGEMIELALTALEREGLRTLRIANRTRANAEVLASRFGASAHGLDELDTLLEYSDVVLTCIGGHEHVIDVARTRRVLRARHNRPIFLIDIGVPRNVDPAVDELDAVYHYDIDDLQEVAARNAEERVRETTRGEAIVLAEQERFEGWLVALQAVPTIRDLRARAEELRAREIARALRRIEFDDDQREVVEHLTRSLVNKLLHPPLAKLRAETDREEGIAMLEAARALFALDDEDDDAGSLDRVGPSAAGAVDEDDGRE